MGDYIRVVGIIGYTIAIGGMVTIILNIQNIEIGLYNGAIYGLVLTILGFIIGGYSVKAADKSDADSAEKNKDELLDKF